MARLIVITLPELAAGFRLAGVRAVVASDAAQAAAAVADLRRQDDVGVLAIHAPLLDGMPPDQQRHLAALTRPVVVAVPDGLRAEDASARRRRLTELLERAVGFRLRLPTEAS